MKEIGKGKKKKRLEQKVKHILDMKILFSSSQQFLCTI